MCSLHEVANIHKTLFIQHLHNILKWKSAPSVRELKWALICSNPTCYKIRSRSSPGPTQDSAHLTPGWSSHLLSTETRGTGRGRCSCGRPGCWGGAGTGSWRGARAATAACRSLQCVLQRGSLRDRVGLSLHCEDHQRASAQCEEWASTT